MLKFSFNDRDYKLVFKHGSAIGPIQNDRMKMCRRGLREIMTMAITTLPVEDRRKSLEYNIDSNDGELGTYRMTSAFIVDLGAKTIAYGPFTAVCVPGDQFVKEQGRAKALNMLSRSNKHNPIIDSGITAYIERKISIPTTINKYKTHLINEIQRLSKELKNI